MYTVVEIVVVIIRLGKDFVQIRDTRAVLDRQLAHHLNVLQIERADTAVWFKQRLVVAGVILLLADRIFDHQNDLGTRLLSALDHVGNVLPIRFKRNIFIIDRGIVHAVGQKQDIGFFRKNGIQAFSALGAVLSARAAVGDRDAQLVFRLRKPRSRRGDAVAVRNDVLACQINGLGSRFLRGRSFRGCLRGLCR